MCSATQQQRDEAMAEQSAQNEEQEAIAVAEAAAAATAQSIAAKGSNRGTGTKYALMTTLEENDSIDAIEDLVVNLFPPPSFPPNARQSSMYCCPS
jgi:hypothetical protein